MSFEIMPSVSTQTDSYEITRTYTCPCGYTRMMTFSTK